MPKFDITPSDDKAEVSISIDGSKVATANALQLDILIQGLTAARGELLPQVPNDPPLGERVQAVVDPRYWTNRDPETGMSLVMFRHPGLGWVSFILPAQERDRLTQYLTDQATTLPAKTEPGTAVH